MSGMSGSAENRLVAVVFERLCPNLAPQAKKTASRIAVSGFFQRLWYWDTPPSSGAFYRIAMKPGKIQDEGGS